MKDMPEEAIERLKEKRPQVGINNAFWPLLREWEAEVRNDGK